MKRTVKQNRHDFKPNDFALYFGEFDIIFRVDMNLSAWYDSLGEDNEDWNKAAGIGKAATANNVSAVLLAWRPYLKEEGVWEFCIYENDSKGRFIEHKVFQVGLKDTAWARFKRSGGKMTITAGKVLSGMINSLEDTVTINMPGVLRERGAWFGGNQAAPQDMEIWVGKTKIKEE